jgi:small subunit ribosomal protein S14
VARTSLKNREIKRQKLVNKYYKLREELRSVLKSTDASLDEKMQASHKLTALPRDSSHVRLSNRCKICSRPRGVFHRRFGLCRLCLRKLARSGMLPGIVKSSW